MFFTFSRIYYDLLYDYLFYKSFYEMETSYFILYFCGSSRHQEIGIGFMNVKYNDLLLWGL